MKVGQLFAEDFDNPEPVTGPEVVETVFSAADMAAAREAAWREGHEAGLHTAEAGDAASTRQAMEVLAEQFATECAAAPARAEAAADAMARLLIDCLTATFPALSARYGDDEVRAIIRTVLPELNQEAKITVRAHPRTAQAVADEIDRINPDLATHIQIVESGTMRPGDVSIAWRNGSAVRDAADLWRQVAAVLAPAGLLQTDAAIMETIDGN